MQAKQLPLFPIEEISYPLAEESTSLSAQTTLAGTMEPFQIFMTRKGFAENTIKSFLGDMRLLMRYLGKTTRLGEIHTKNLNAFLTWLVEGRKVPCSDKSYARRVTTLKVFFRWLKEEEVLPTDPAANVVQLKAVSPLPLILSPGQINDMLAVTAAFMSGEKPDARPHLLVKLILTTGIKKSECMGIKLAHIDMSNPAAPVLHIRYEKPRYRVKDRSLRLPDDFAPTFALYQERYQPKMHLFECTARNLEYVLHDIAAQARLPSGLSFEMLRWTCAVRDYKSGMDEDLLRMKLGLSPVSWPDVLAKIHKLAEPPL